MIKKNLFGQKRFWLGLGITIVFLYLVFRQVNIQELTTALASADYRWLLPALAVYLTGYWLRAIRWAYLMNAVKPLSWQRLFPPLIMGFMVNNVLPARAGEFVRAYLVGRREAISKTAVFATVVMQRLYDGLVMVLLATTVLWLYRIPHTAANAAFVQVMNTVVNLTAALFIVLFVLFFGMITWKEKWFPLINKLVGWLPRGIRPAAEKITHSFIDGFAGMKSHKDSLLAFLFTLLAWCGESAAYYFVLKAFGLHLPVYAAVMMMAIVNLGIMLPSSPGYIGPFEFFGVGTLLLFGVAKSLSLPAVLIIHALVWLPITLWGFYYMWTYKMSFKEIEETKEPSQATISAD